MNFDCCCDLNDVGDQGDKAGGILDRKGMVFATFFTNGAHLHVCRASFLPGAWSASMLGYM